MIWELKEFKVLGLSKAEQKVLKVCSDSLMGLPEICRATRFSRTGTQYVLIQLEEKKLVKSTRRGSRKFFQAVGEKEFLYILEKLMLAVNPSAGISSSSKVLILKRNGTTIKVYTTRDGVIDAYFNIVKKNKFQRIRGLQHHRSFLEIIEKLGVADLVTFNQTMHKNKLILDGLLNRSAYQAMHKEIIVNPSKFKPVAESLGEDRIADYGVFPDNFFNYDTELWIHGNTATLINWKEDFAIEMTNENIAGFLTDMYKHVKAVNQKLDHHSALRRTLMDKDL